jgi:hypothetical protein
MLKSGGLLSAGNKIINIAIDQKCIKLITNLARYTSLQKTRCRPAHRIDPHPLPVLLPEPSLKEKTNDAGVQLNVYIGATNMEFPRNFEQDKREKHYQDQLKSEISKPRQDTNQSLPNLTIPLSVRRMLPAFTSR